jgi:hypothetical protein
VEKISRMEVMIESLHDVIDDLAGVFLALLGEVEIEHGGFQSGVAQVALDDAQVDASFEEMSGVRMAQGVDGNALFEHPSGPHGLAKGALDAALGHRLGCLMGIVSLVTASREDKPGMAVSEPIAAQPMEGRLGQRDVAVLGALAAVDMDHHASGVDIGDFEVETFVKSQAAGVYGGKISIVLKGLDSGQNASDFFHAQDGRKASFILGSEDSEDVPVALEDMLVEEAYPAIANTHGIRRPVVSVFAAEEIFLKLFFGNEIGRPAVGLDEHAQGPCIGLLRAFPFAVELKGLNHSVIPLCLHDTSPFSLRMDFPFQ